MDQSTGVSTTTQFDNFVRGIYNEFNLTEEIAGLMAMKRTAPSEYLYDETKEELQKCNIPVQKLVVTDGAPSNAGENSGLSSLITKEMANTTGRDLLAYHYLIHQETLCQIRING
jgi:hypothetical protein